MNEQAHHLVELVDRLGNAAFDCGEWHSKFADEAYDDVQGRADAAREELLTFVERLVAGLERQRR